MRRVTFLLAATGCAPSALDTALDEAGADYSVNSVGAPLYDVHGAGAQRSDPKSGDPADYAGGHGPQGDVVRIDNFVRCVSGEPYGLPDTGQTRCYDDGDQGAIDCPGQGEAFHGQDAAYDREGPDYTAEGEVVWDEVSGLAWTAAWYQTTWDERDASAAARDDGGFTDWRVPTVTELYSLARFDGATGTADPSDSQAPADAEPYIDGAFDFEYPSTDRYIDAQYLSATEYSSAVVVDPNRGEQAVMFGVNFADGRIKGYPLTGTGSSDAFYVRYVRGGEGYGEAALTDSGDGTITDATTGLTWAQEDYGPADWAAALDWCEALTLGGASDWRLPDARELQSLVDYSRSPDATGSAAIDPLFESTPIVDEEGGLDFPYYWSSTTHDDGPVEGEWAIYVAFGEAVGYGSSGL